MARAFLQRIGAAWPGIQLAVRASLAAVLSLIAAGWLELHYPIYAFIAAVIVTDLNPAVSQKLALRRVGATLVGAVCGASLSFLTPGVWAVGLGILLAMLLAQLLKAGEGSRVRRLHQRHRPARSQYSTLGLCSGRAGQGRRG